MFARLLILVALLAGGSLAELLVLSDLSLLNQPTPQKFDCPDAFSPRSTQVLSPAVPRGGHLTLILALRHDHGQPFDLTIGQNPAGALPFRLYRLLPTLNPAVNPVAVRAPFRGRIGESESCALFVLDVDVPANLPPGRIKLEPAVWLRGVPTANAWLRAPLEVRPLPQATTPACEVPVPLLDRLLVRNAAADFDQCLSLEQLRAQAAAWAILRRGRGRGQ